ncbi:hypothetical protein L1887_58865 [Cichorium endivia]|nr:hypothetical protein L1887_58865 [Cichorium endivia]
MRLAQRRHAFEDADAWRQWNDEFDIMLRYRETAERARLFGRGSQRQRSKAPCAARSAGLKTSSAAPARVGHSHRFGLVPGDCDHKRPIASISSTAPVQPQDAPFPDTTGDDLPSSEDDGWSSDFARQLSQQPPAAAVRASSPRPQTPPPPTSRLLQGLNQLSAGLSDDRLPDAFGGYQEDENDDDSDVFDHAGDEDEEEEDDDDLPEERMLKNKMGFNNAYLHVGPQAKTVLEGRKKITMQFEQDGPSASAKTSTSRPNAQQQQRRVRDSDFAEFDDDAHDISHVSLSPHGPQGDRRANAGPSAGGDDFDIPEEVLHEDFDPDRDSDDDGPLAATGGNATRDAYSDSDDDDFVIDHQRSSNMQDQCFRELKKLNAKLAEKEGVQLSQFVPDELLYELSAFLPTNTDLALAKLENPNRWFRKYAGRFVRICRRHVEATRVQHKGSEREHQRMWDQASSNVRPRPAASSSSSTPARAVATAASTPQGRAAPRKSALLAAANLEQYTYDEAAPAGAAARTGRASLGSSRPAAPAAASKTARSSLGGSKDSAAGGSAKRLTLARPFMPTSGARGAVNIAPMPLKISRNHNRPRPS